MKIHNIKYYENTVSRTVEYLNECSALEKYRTCQCYYKKFLCILKLYHFENVPRTRNQSVIFLNERKKNVKRNLFLYKEILDKTNFSQIDPSGYPRPPYDDFLNRSDYLKVRLYVNNILKKLKRDIKEIIEMEEIKSDSGSEDEFPNEFINRVNKAKNKINKMKRFERSQLKENFINKVKVEGFNVKECDVCELKPNVILRCHHDRPYKDSIEACFAFVDWPNIYI